MAQKKKRKKHILLNTIKQLLFGTGWNYKPKGDEEKVGFVDDLDGDGYPDYVLIKEDDGDYAYVQKIEKYRKGGKKDFAVEQSGELMSKVEYKKRKRNSDDGLVKINDSHFIDKNAKVYKIPKNKIDDIDDLKFVSQHKNKKDLSFYRQQKKADRRFDRQLKKKFKMNKNKSFNVKKTKAKKKGKERR